MTKVNKKLVNENDCSQNFKNYSLKQLLKMDNGISVLIHHFTFCDPNCTGEDEWISLSWVLVLQTDIQEAIQSKIFELIPESELD